ncbi:MAG TPA: Smr/MutS family protein [Xanthobacteraceae bacterium]|nr:Smr/MutS family protein [Xanthobacteraceae bacterium]
MPSRKLRDDDLDLWKSVTRTVTPLPRPRALAPEPQDENRSAAKSSTKSKPVPKPVFPPRPAAQLPALAPIDRRTKQRLARGLEPIDARLDLHGCTQAQAHAALLTFLRRAQTQDAKTVLVITGKGGDDPVRERGVLRRQVPLWLALPEFRKFVVGFEPAHIAHGGEGAFYVRVRRAR